MALIRCPQCNAGHELDDALLKGGSRRVRCASCRTVWATDFPESTGDNVGWDIDYSKAPDKPASEPQAQGDIDALFDQPLTKPEPKPQSQDDIDSLFAEPAKPASPASPAPASQGDVDALFAAPAPAPAPTAILEPAPIIVAPPPTAQQELEEAAERRSERRRKATEEALLKTKKRPPAEPVGGRSFAVMFAAASLGTLATLLIFRHDVARLAPWTAPIFETIGLSAEEKGLIFEDVKSRVTREENRDTLEVTGTIHNKTNRRIPIPMLRLALRGEGGQELYVWTATADQTEIGAGDKVQFRRRLASPPTDSHSVEVRFVSPQDVVASVR